jgi:hypothetical protein
MAAAAQSKLAKQAGKAKATDSTIAKLPAHTTTQAAHAPRAAALKTGVELTGQYLFDRLIGDDSKADLSKMDVVRLMVPMDVGVVKGAIADMVAIAKSASDAADKDAKAGGWDGKADSKPVAVRKAQATLKTAQNHQSVMRVAYGALKFAEKQLKALGAGADTGYLLMQQLGSKALADAGLNWDGTKAETKEQRDARRAQGDETKAMLKVQAEHPRKPNESRADYYARIDKQVEKELGNMRAEQHRARVEALATKFRKDAGDDLAEVLEYIATQKDQPANPAADASLH